MFFKKLLLIGLISWVPMLFFSVELSASEKHQTGQLEGQGTRLVGRPVEIRINLLENSEKGEAKQPERVLTVLGVKEADVVADVGAGTGLFTFHLAQRVGPKGKVYATEIEDRLIDFIRSKADQRQAKNIFLIKSSATSPNLPPSSCDKIVMAGVYYYLTDPETFMENVRKALKPEGKLALIDLDGEKFNENIKKKKQLSKLPKVGQIIDELRAAGFELRESHDFLSRRFFLIFTTAR